MMIELPIYYKENNCKFFIQFDESRDLYSLYFPQLENEFSITYLNIDENDVFDIYNLVKNIIETDMIDQNFDFQILQNCVIKIKNQIESQYGIKI